ncbi:hydroxysqualene dehydroxylase HpnE [Pseudorhodoplanes sp.]|uniref:hydroxysqualene dehydroxylase HpnE n=1 Tax=Pseudorhodoplanes sp. TaxID=1934341 RepID=UPI002B6C77C5|nr:hydroxysqualene dehydroxylase HpnE [Pseudorhodoplanes sp.]HWV53553.1 hydroxysqualene dehydroxylase HpnE [Pseudorhodoplanes sp.]
MIKHVHVVGAGLAGLSAAVRLTQAGIAVTVHEATRQAGGRCRSYDDAATGMHIDNGTHLLLSGNRSAVDYLKAIGVTPDFAPANFRFVDGATGESWILRLGNGSLPTWIFDAASRVPKTSLLDYLKLLPLLLGRADRPLREVLDRESELYRRLIDPLMVAALNIDTPSGSSLLASQVARETLLRGGEACRPLVFERGLSTAFVEPALKALRERGAEIRFEHEVESVTTSDRALTALRFRDGETVLGPEDAVVLAVPAYAAAALVPTLKAPDQFRAIINIHYDLAPPDGSPFMTGVLGRTVEWIFAFRHRISTTISHADRLLTLPRQELAETAWREITDILGMNAPIPKWQLVRERRATFAATPAQNARRNETKTRWANLAVAGDWTDTGLPATIEGAIRSGQRAAELLSNR